MTFETMAKDLLNKAKSPQPNNGEAGSVVERANVLVELSNHGFSVQETISELRCLYDSTDDDGLRKQLLDMIIKVHGLYKDEDRKEIPRIVFNITADPTKLNLMLCPAPIPDTVL